MRSYRQIFFSLVFVCAAAITPLKAQDTVTISQKGKAFSESSVTIKSGAKVRFVNDDTVAHNVYARIGSDKEDLGLQKPGEQGEISFDKPGKYRVRCAIHPKMKLTVVVE